MILKALPIYLGISLLQLFRILAVNAVPTGFPASGNGLWFDQPAVNWTTQYLPIGNGYLGAMVNGNPSSDRIQLNIESLWTGGPFQNASYNGGNHPSSEASYLAAELARIRQTIFTSGNGTIANIEPLGVDPGTYGTYSSPGYFSINHTTTGNITNYARWLDLDTAVLKTTWTESKSSFTRTYFCSNPSRACTIHTNTSTAGALSATFSLTSLAELPAPNVTCLDATTLQLRGYAASPGMLYEIMVKIGHAGPTNSSAGCTFDQIGKPILFTNGSTEAWITWGTDPHAQLTGLLAKAVAQSPAIALASHIEDYQRALGGFSLNIGQKVDTTKTTDVLKKEYKTDIGNPRVPYLEWLLFNYRRYLLVGRARGYLPANLQGKWARDTKTPWDGDYHANINLQMNYWIAETTNLNVTASLWDYMARNWAPRGSETAKTLYGARGWVVHDEMNIFGHSGMKYSPPRIVPKLANYPEARAWMVSWWQAQGWLLLKGVASFWLDHMVEDIHFKDGTFVTAPCNSPEQDIITFGCANSQQLVWQLFEAVEKGFGASGDTNRTFLEEVQAKKSRLDKGPKIGSFGQLQAPVYSTEWKVEFDKPTNTHRHLSHLVGLYPGYVNSNFKPSSGQNQTLTREQVLNAAEISLASRGNGTGSDGDAGWEKVWRAACWAQLQNSTRFYHQLTYAIERNFAENLWSLYDPSAADPRFQIDANLGYPAVVLNALVQAPDTSSLSDTLRITILPALTIAWATGSLNGARIRGGMSVDLVWADGQPTRVRIKVDAAVRVIRQVEIWYGGKVIVSFSASAGLVKDVKF
ncbi:hypothetical protein FRC12_013755 [Ceratobasidium sp. 428]|nr:hypothetical protein FRC12_013755 [Ceratobasidium sp. 428]